MRKKRFEVDFRREKLKEPGLCQCGDCTNFGDCTDFIPVGDEAFRIRVKGLDYGYVLPDHLISWCMNNQVFIYL